MLPLFNSFPKSFPWLSCCFSSWQYLIFNYIVLLHFTNRCFLAYVLLLSNTPFVPYFHVKFLCTLSPVHIDLISRASYLQHLIRQDHSLTVMNLEIFLNLWIFYRITILVSKRIFHLLKRTYFTCPFHYFLCVKQIFVP